MVKFMLLSGQIPPPYNNENILRENFNLFDVIAIRVLGSDPGV